MTSSRCTKMFLGLGLMMSKLDSIYPSRRFRREVAAAQTKCSSMLCSGRLPLRWRRRIHKRHMDLEVTVLLQAQYSTVQNCIGVDCKKRHWSTRARACLVDDVQCYRSGALYVRRTLGLE